MLHQDDPLTSGDIVAALGGPTAISRNPEINAKRSAISNWPQEGIPAKYWPALARLAAQSEATRHITLERLERHRRGPVRCVQQDTAA